MVTTSTQFLLSTYYIATFLILVYIIFSNSYNNPPYKLDTIIIPILKIRRLSL